MNKGLKKIFSFIFTLMIIFLVPVNEVQAAEEIITIENNAVKLDSFIFEIPTLQNPDISIYATNFVDASIILAFSSRGLGADIYTQMNQIASVVGIKDIEVQKKVWYGWTTVATADGGESYDSAGTGCSILYEDAIVGQTYRVRCIHYGNVDGYREIETITDAEVFRY